MADIGLSRRAGVPDGFAAALYWAMAAILIGGLGWVYVTDPPFTHKLNNDFWEHSAAIREWMGDLWHPRNPHLMTDIGSPRYMPYFFVLAILGNVLGLEAIDVLKIAAIFNIALLTLGVFLFFRVYFRSHLAPVIGLVVLLTAWGTGWTWSNVTQLRTLFYVGPYPSTFCFALTLVCLWLQTRMLRSDAPPIKHHIALAALVAVLVASHPLTGSFAIVSLLLLALFHPRVRFGTRAGLAIAVVLGLGLAELWPYYSVLKVTLGVSGGEAKSWVDGGAIAWDARPRLLLKHPFYNPVQVLLALGPILVGFLCLGFLARQREHRFILFGAIAMLTPYAVNLVYPIPLGHRFLLFAIFFLHLALVWAVVGCLDRAYSGLESGRTRGAAKVALGGIGAVIALGLIFNTAFAVVDVRQRLAGQDRMPAHIAEIVRSVPRDGVVMARPILAWPIPTFAGKVISLFHRNPMVPDMAERDRSVTLFFDPASSAAERAQILRDYSVSHVLIDSADTPDEVRRYLSSIGIVRKTFGNLRLVEVRPTSARAD